jgi:hypothetical protein
MPGFRQASTRFRPGTCLAISISEKQQQTVTNSSTHYQATPGARYEEARSTRATYEQHALASSHDSLNFALLVLTN